MIKQLSLLALANLAAAAVPPSRNAKVCSSYSIPVQVTTKNYVFPLPPFKDNFDVADAISIVTSRTTPRSPALFSQTETSTRKYTIAGTFCQPASNTQWWPPTAQGGKARNVLLLTHGLNANKLYWDPTGIDDQYSFVDFAVAQGYSVFFYDRVGAGDSTKESGYVSQLSIQAAVLQELAKKLKAGQYTKDIGVPKTVTFVGHSFGCSISIQALTNDVAAADGLILTGWSFNSAVQNLIGLLEVAAPRIAATQSRRFAPSRYDNGYLTPVDVFAEADIFFKAPNYDEDVAFYVDDNKEPLGVMEYLTAGALTGVPSGFKGPVMIITGKYDFVFCTGDCDGGVLDQPPGRSLFPSAKDFSAVVHPGTGHALNLHKNSPAAFSNITAFLTKNGI